MSNNSKVKLYVVYMVESNNDRTPIGVNLSESSAQENRIFLSANFENITFVVDECVVDNPTKFIHEAINNLISLLK